jgi:hypothetical protein
MRLFLQEGESPADLDFPSWHVLIHGVPVDDRGRTALQFGTARTVSQHRLQHEPESLSVELDGINVVVDEFGDALKAIATGRVLIEATTLGVVELVLCCKALRRNGVGAFDILYVEPDDYKRPRRDHLLHKRDFELSREVPGYRAIPGSALYLRDRKPFRTVFFLGYEDARLRRAFEEVPMLVSESTAVVFGVPAFRAGWEMHAMANNIGVIKEHNIRGGVYFCGAENPYAVLELLGDIYQGVDGERLVLAPIGTKPHGVGVALFAATHDDVGIIYDHPQRTKGRSSDVGHWHLFSIDDYQGNP